MWWEPRALALAIKFYCELNTIEKSIKLILNSIEGWLWFLWAWNDWKIEGGIKWLGCATKIKIRNSIKVQRITSKSYSSIFFMSHPFNKRIAMEHEKMPACNNFCTTSSLSSSSHVSHFTAIIFSSKKRKKIMLHFEWERAFISNIYTKDIFAWVGRSFNSIFRSYAKLFLCISFSHFLLAIHPKICAFLEFFLSLSIFSYSFLCSHVCVLYAQSISYWWWWKKY